MAADAGLDPAKAGSERRGHAERLAVRRLEAALIEQARVGDAYALSVSTSAEQSSYLRLRAASLQVSRCDRAVKTFSAEAVEAGTGSQRMKATVSVKQKTPH